MSLIDLNPVDSATSTLPFYNETNFDPTIVNTLSNLGWAVDIIEDGNLVAISQPNYYDNRRSGTGSEEYIFIYQKTNEVWSLVDTLINSVEIGGSSNSDNFGYALSLSKTNGEFLCVSSIETHQVHIFQSDLGSTPSYSFVNTITVGSDKFGFNVKLSADGTSLVVLDRLGVCYAYSTTDDWVTPTLNNTIGTGLAYTNSTDAFLGLDVSAANVIIRGLPLVPVGDPTTATGRVDIITSGSLDYSITGSVAGGRMGGAVSVSSDGNYLAIGEAGLATMNTNERYLVGKVHIYLLVGSTFTFQQTLTPADVSVTAVALSGSFGNALAMNSTGNLLSVADAFSNELAGDTHLFERNDATWDLEQASIGAILSTSATTTLVATNNTLTTSVASVTIPVGTYTGFELATQMKTSLDAGGGGPWTVVFSYITGLFTVSRASVFTLTFNAFAGIIGFEEDQIDAITYTSAILANMSFRGSEVGHSVSLNNTLVSAIVLGKPGQPNPNVGQGQFAINEKSTTSIVRDERLIVDTNDNIALGVRKDQDNGYVLEVDTINDQVRITADVFITGNVDITEAILNVDDITGTNGITISGGQNPGNNLILQSTTNDTKGMVTIPDELEVLGVTVTHNVFSTGENITALSKQNLQTSFQQTLTASNWRTDTTMTGFNNSGLNATWVEEKNYWLTVNNTTPQNTYSSPDGKIWTSTGISVSGNGTAFNINAEKADVILVMQGNACSYSTDSGDSFSTGTYPNTGTFIIDSTYSKTLDRFAAVDQQGANNNQVIYSDDDGATWTSSSVTGPFTAGDINLVGIVYSDDLELFVCCSQNFGKNAYYSTDAINWTQGVFGFGTGTQSTGIAYSPRLKKFCIVMISGPTGVRSYTSLDGINWSQSPATFPEDVQVRRVIWSEELGIFVACANSGTLRIFSSPDGDTWTGYNVGAMDAQYMGYSPQLVQFVVSSQGPSTDAVAPVIYSYVGRPGHSNTIFSNPGEMHYIQSTKTLCMAAGTTLDAQGASTFGASTAASLSNAGLLTINNATDATIPTATASIHTEGGISVEKVLSVNNVSLLTTNNNPESIVSIKTTGSTASLADTATPTSITALDFSGQRSFRIDGYFEIIGTGAGYSYYELIGLNETTVGSDSWVLSVVRTGTSDPGVTFTITSGGIVQHAFAGAPIGFTTAKFMYDIVSNIQ